MKVLIFVCFILFVTDKATGQTIDPVCSNVIDFGLCLNNWDCDPDVSRCSCFEGQPYCRCNNLKGEFYIDEDCSQRWTLVTFALVASLPGFTLAVLVGVIVYVIMLSSTKSHKNKDVSAASPKEQDLFPGITFASDLNSQPAPNTRPVQPSQIPMINMPNCANSGTRDQPMGGPARPYSMSGGTRDGLMESAQPYSNASGYGQTVNNPYARDLSSQNPYNNRTSSDYQNDYRQPAPSHPYQDVNQQYSSAPHYGSPERGNSRGGFPRPHINPRY